MWTSNSSDRIVLLMAIWATFWIVLQQKTGTNAQIIGDF